MRASEIRLGTRSPGSPELSWRLRRTIVVARLAGVDHRRDRDQLRDDPAFD
jgi:hypothetical protein